MPNPISMTWDVKWMSGPNSWVDFFFFLSENSGGNVKESVSSPELWVAASRHESTPFNMTQPDTMNQLTWFLRKLLFVRITEFTRTTVHLSLMFLNLSNPRAMEQELKKWNVTTVISCSVLYLQTGQRSNGIFSKRPLLKWKGEQAFPCVPATLTTNSGLTEWRTERAQETTGWKPCGESEATVTTTIWQNRQCHEALPQLRRQHTHGLRWTTGVSRLPGIRKEDAACVETSVLF